MSGKDLAPPSHIHQPYIVILGTYDWIRNYVKILLFQGSYLLLVTYCLMADYFELGNIWNEIYGRRYDTPKYLKPKKVDFGN